MMYILMLFIGLSAGLLIDKIIDLRKAKIDEEFVNLIDKVVFEEKEENVEKKTNSNKIRKNYDDRR